MTIDTLIMFAGALVAILPYLGFPNSWDSVFFLILGIIVISLGIIVRRRGGPGHDQHSHIVEVLPVREESERDTQ